MMNSKTICVPNISGFLGVGDYVKTMDEKVTIINNITNVRNNFHVEVNLCKAAKASEWNYFTNLNSSDFIILSCNTECKMKELVKIDQIMQ